MIRGTKATVAQRNVRLVSSPTASGTAQSSTARAPAATAPSTSANSTEFVASARRVSGFSAAKFALASCTPAVARFPSSSAIAVSSATCPRPSGPSSRATIRMLPSDRIALPMFVPQVRSAEPAEPGRSTAGPPGGWGSERLTTFKSVTRLLVVPVNREQIPLGWAALGIECSVQAEVFDAAAGAGPREVVLEPGACVGRHLRQRVVGRHLRLAGVEEHDDARLAPDRPQHPGRRFEAVGADEVV